MNNTIQPEVLKSLMARQNLTQQALADLTAANHMPVGVATIKRICSPKGAPVKQRANTITSLAKALKVKPEALTAREVPALDEGYPLNAYVTMKAQVTRNVDLSFQSVEAIYGIPRSAQVAMAPLFAALIAETSLKWRQDRLAAVGSIADQLDKLRGENPLLNGAFSRTWEAEKVEQQSIEQKDVLGHHALKELEELFELSSKGFGSLMNHDVPNLLPEEWASPFYAFLKDYAKGFGKTQIEIQTDRYDESSRMSDGMLDYRVGQQLINEICGDSNWARRVIEKGFININEIPRELLPPEQVKERIAFLKARITDADRAEMARREIEGLNEFLTIRGKDQLEVSDEQIARILSSWDQEDVH